MGKVTPITEQFQHFVRDGKESLGGAERESSSGDEAVAGGGIAATTGPLLVPGGVGAAGTRAGLPPRVLRAGLREAVGDAAAADRADAGAGVFAGRDAGVSAAGRGGDVADPGGVFARDLDAESGASGGAGNAGGGERADGLDGGQEPGSARTTVPRSTAARRMGLLIVGRGGPARAALRQAQGGPSTSSGR